LPAAFRSATFLGIQPARDDGLAFAAVPEEPAATSP